MMKRVVVTQNDIKNGVRGSTFSCPVALALLRAGFITPSVAGCYFYSSGYVRPGFYQIKFDLPLFVATKIDDFDRRQKIVPFMFHVEVK